MFLLTSLQPPKDPRSEVRMVDWSASCISSSPNACLCTASIMTSSEWLSSVVDGSILLGLMFAKTRLQYAMMRMIFYNDEIRRNRRSKMVLVGIITRRVGRASRSLTGVAENKEHVLWFGPGTRLAVYWIFAGWNISPEWWWCEALDLAGSVCNKRSTSMWRWLNPGESGRRISPGVHGVDG